MNDQDVTAVLERVIGPLEDEMGSWDDVLGRAAEASPEGWDDVLHPSGAEHPPLRALEAERSVRLGPSALPE